MPSSLHTHISFGNKIVFAHFLPLKLEDLSPIEDFSSVLKLRLLSLKTYSLQWNKANCNPQWTITPSLKHAQISYKNKDLKQSLKHTHEAGYNAAAGSHMTCLVI